METIILFSLISLIIGILVGSIIIAQTNKPKTNQIMRLPFSIEQYTSEKCFKTIDGLIDATIMYKIEEEIGDSLGAGNASPEELAPDVISRINGEVQEYVILNISDSMREYLFNIYGEEYIRIYIRTKTLASLPEYYISSNRDYKSIWRSM